MPRGTLTTNPGSGPNIETFVLPDGTEVPTSLIRAMTAAGVPVDLVAKTDGTLLVSISDGTYGYAAGTAATTVDVPATARVKRVSVISSSTGTATITIAGGATITVPANGSFDESIPGSATAGGDVVIAGNVASYYVAWVS